MVICKLDDYNMTFTFTSIQVDSYWETQVTVTGCTFQVGEYNGSIYILF